MAGIEGNEDIAVTVIGGYLGAGKTTLVNHILRTASERIAVLVNDFGDVNIDADLIESEDGDTISLANGCICCSLVDGFAAALQTVRELDPAPTRLVIEASGVADPATVAAYGHGPGLSLDAVVVVVDAETVQEKAGDRYVGDTIRAQLEAADILVLNKTDLVDADDADRTAWWVAERAPEALLIRVTDAEVDPEILFGRFPDGRPSVPSPGEPSQTPAEAIYEAWRWSGTGRLAQSDVEALMGALPDEVIRAKGLLALAEREDRVMVLQRVGRRWSLRAGPASSGDDRSELVLIGFRGAIDDGWLAQYLPG